MPDSLIIIPTFNEKENIEKLISEIFGYVSDIDILIVDDNSPDGTSAIADRIAQKDKRVSVLHRMSRRGRGYAGVDAFKEALKRKDILYIMEMDADFSHDPKYIPYFLKETKQNDIVIGSRFIERGRDTERNILRVFLSKIVNFFIKKYLGLNINDCSSGYRCFKRQVIASLDLDSLISKGPAIIEETLYISNLKKYKIKEIPIAFKARYKGKTKLGLVKLSRVFMDIVYFKKIHLCCEKTKVISCLSKEKEKNIEELRKFGFRLSSALNVAGFIMFWRGRGHFIWFTCIGSAILIAAIVFPGALALLKKALDFVILSIGHLINMISLLAVFYLIFTPIGILLRFFRRDILNQRINKSAGSYWIKRQAPFYRADSYERMG